MTTAADVRAALTGRWPDDAHLHIAEAPDGPSRQGRKLDVLVVSLWASRGYDLDGVEIKVSVSDWRRELKQPAKADWWWKHVTRFWIAAPSDVATKIKHELPSGWGLLSVTDSGCRVVVQAEKHKPEPLTWPQTVGLLRATADSGFGALQRAEARGYDRGHSAARARYEGGGADERLKRDLADLRKKVDDFEQASGIDLATTWDGARLGETVKTLLFAQHHPARIAETLAQAEKQLQRSLAALGTAKTALAIEPAPTLFDEGAA